MAEMKIAVLGAAGRMGQALIRTIAATPGCVVAGGPLLVFASGEAVLDFTTPASTTAFAVLSAQARIVHVIGTTGLSENDEAKIEAAARHATIVKAGNMSQGVNLLAVLTARVAEALGPEFDIEILEM